MCLSPVVSATTKGSIMISTVDLTRKGLLRIIGYLEVTDLPASERFNAAINDLVKWVEDYPEDLDRFFAATPTVYPKWETDKVLAEVSALPVDLADYDHVGLKSSQWVSDWHDQNRTDLP
jgi:hypothetical protein